MLSVTNSPDKADSNEANAVVTEPLSLAKRAVVGSASGLLLILAITALPSSLGTFPSWVTRVGSTVTLFGLAIWFTRRNYYLPIRNSHKKTAVLRLPDAQVYSLQRSAGHLDITPQQASTFALSILVPTGVRERITERYEPGQRTLTQKVTIEGYLADKRGDIPPATESPSMDATGEEQSRQPPSERIRLAKAYFFHY